MHDSQGRGLTSSFHISDQFSGDEFKENHMQINSQIRDTIRIINTKGLLNKNQLIKFRALQSTPTSNIEGIIPTINRLS